MSSRMSKKSKKVANDRHSQIIVLSVRYLQLVASYDAGFSADPTGNCEFAIKGRLLPRAKRALIKLVGLSPLPGDGALSLNELRAKAAVLKELYGFRKDEELDEVERAFTAVFASECVQTLESLAAAKGEA